MNVFTSYLEKLGANFLVAAMVPSLAFVIAIILVFDPILNIPALFEDQSGVYQLIGLSLLLAIPTIIIGFTLTALNTYILKLFEGYVFWRRFPFMRAAHQRKANRLILRQEALKRRIEIVESYGAQTNRTKRVLLRLRKQYYLVSADYDHSYPPSQDEILPTRFGNILKASESYPNTRYGIDGVEFWPRLIHVIPPEYQQSIDGTRNELSFLVNMSILAIVFFLLCILAIFYTFAGPALRTSTIPPEFVGFGNTIRYSLAGLLALTINIGFNRASVYSVGAFGMMVRSAYDLFRLDLLEKFRLQVPENSVDEFHKWKNLNELIVLGPKSLEFEPLEYDLEK